MSSAPAIGHRKPRLLVIVESYVDDRPATGHEMRRAHTIRAAASVGPTDVFVVQSLSAEASAVMTEVFGVSIHHGAPSEPHAPGFGARQLSRFAPSTHRTPLARAQRHRLIAHFERSTLAYDSVVLPIYEYRLLREVLQGRAIVELSDIPSDYVKQQRQLAFRRAMQTDTAGRWARVPYGLGSGLIRLRRLPRAGIRWIVAIALELQWRRTERLTLMRADLVLLSNLIDAAKLGRPTNAAIVPNGFDLEGVAVGSSTVRTPPIVGFWGTMAYAPNADGARWFVRHVLPLVRVRLPDVRFLIAGRGVETLGLEGVPSVELVGFTPELSELLGRIDVAAVPLRSGTGTRIKIVEAWAQRIPVVSTSIGAYGLIGDGNDAILLADDPQSFADSLVESITNVTVRENLIVAGEAAAADRTWGHMEDILRALLTGVSSRTIAT